MIDVSRLGATNLGKRFAQGWLFKGVDMDMDVGHSLAITGANGSGKSTLLQLLWGFKTPSAGATWLEDAHGNPLPLEQVPFACTFSAPYQAVPEQWTGAQVAAFHYKARQTGYEVKAMLDAIGIGHVAGLQVAKYSSGQRQRLRLALTLFDDAPVLLLDEPCANLDATGRARYLELVWPLLEKKIVVIASNDAAEYPFATQHIALAEYSPYLARA